MSGFYDENGALCTPDPAYAKRDPRHLPRKKTAGERAMDHRYPPVPYSSPAPDGPMTERTAQDIKKLLYANLLSGGNHPYTAIATTMQGEKIGTTNRYIDLYRNELGRVVGVRVVLEPAANMSARVKLSYGTDLLDQNKIDELYAQGRLNSEWILLRAGQTLYVNTGDTNFTVTGATLRVLLFDPSVVFGGDIIP